MRVLFKFGSAGILSKNTSCSRRQLLALALVSGLSLGLAASGCSKRPNVFNQSRQARLARLDEEKNDLARTNDPVDRTRIQIRISDLMISFMIDAIQAGNPGLIPDLTVEYQDAIVDAQKTMMNSGRDPTRNVAGFRDLEIALRQQIRQLTDIGNSLTLAQRQPIDEVVVEATEIRNELLDALFPDS